MNAVIHSDGWKGETVPPLTRQTGLTLAGRRGQVILSNPVPPGWLVDADDTTGFLDWLVVTVTPQTAGGHMMQIDHQAGDRRSAETWIRQNRSYRLRALGDEPDQTTYYLYRENTPSGVYDQRFWEWAARVA